MPPAKRLLLLLPLPLQWLQQQLQVVTRRLLLLLLRFGFRGFCIVWTGTRRL